ncbi:pyridoxine/pyridoxal/pyridoxamine kinase [Glutamicibacter endophyticus]
MHDYELDTRPVDAVLIGAQLAYGSTGNNITIRFLERSGFRAVQVPTALLSNLPLFPSSAGGELPDGYLSGILEELLRREVLATARYIVVGYLGNARQAEILGAWYRKAREHYPQLRLIVDPDIGDAEAGLHADPAVVHSYIEHLLPLAWLMTPNLFELGVMAEESVEDEEQILQAAYEVIDAGVPNLIVTSVPGDTPELIGTLLATEDEQVEQVDTLRVATSAKGAGACLLGALVVELLRGTDLSESMAQAVIATAQVLAGEDSAFAPRD